MRSAGRRRVVFVLVAMVLLAGCSAAPGDSRQSPSPPTATEPRPEPTSTPSTTTRTTTDPGLPTIPPERRLTVYKRIEESVTLSIYSHGPLPADSPNATPRREPEASVTYGPEETGSVHVTGVELDGYAVLTLDGRVIWVGVVGPAYQVDVRSHEDGSAEEIGRIAV